MTIMRPPLCPTDDPHPRFRPASFARGLSSNAFFYYSSPFQASFTIADGPAYGADAPGYRIATVAWAGWSPLHVADEKGFWTDLGLDVEVVDYDNPVVILEAIRAGRIDFAMDMAGTLVGVHMDGTPLVVLAETNWSHGGDRIIVHRGDTVERHTGDPVGVFLNRPSCLYFLGLYLKGCNRRLSDFRIIEIDPEDMGHQFAAGRLPVIVSYDPWALQAMREGDGACLASSADFKGCIPECLWAYAGRLDTIPPDHVRKVIQGWIRAVRWMRDPANWPELCDILNRRTFHNQPPRSDEELRQLLSGVSIHEPEVMRERNRVNGGLYAYLRSLRAFLAENGLLRRPYSVPDIFDNRFVMEALAAEGVPRHGD